MSGKKKAKQPPIDGDEVRRRLERALGEQLLVRLTRWIPEADRIFGFVVGVGGQWVALADVADWVRSDGWSLVRLKDVQAVKIYPDPETFTIRALKLRGEWPPQQVAVDLDDTARLIMDATDVSPLLTVHCEFERPDVCWIGAPVATDDDELTMLEIGTQAVWGRRSTRYDLDDITRFEIGGGYEETLGLLAGPMPDVLE
ncbi:hypothetical protein [Nocardioides sp. Kera G14]|uniref:hypothetical protein n=1 Tax=Nocardioides sp. Kera G14 TaxID=2884264 RepID=UPI001D12576B|nr:hypothetical protein [Nocardioides sp. Kera G14]UDY23781.1 hypothetical protein LH076_00340 [Nocardioides sp. Kera G14]